MIGARIEPGGTLVYILDIGDIDRLRGGKAVVAHDRSFMIRFTPDIRFTENQIQDAFAAGVVMDMSALERIMEESKKRKVVVRARSGRQQD